MLPKGKYRMLQEHPTWSANHVAESLPEKLRCAIGPEDKWESRMQESHLGKGTGGRGKAEGSLVRRCSVKRATSCGRRVMGLIPDSGGEQFRPTAKLEVDFGNWSGRLKCVKEITVQGEAVKELRGSKSGADHVWGC